MKTEKWLSVIPGGLLLLCFVACKSPQWSQIPALSSPNGQIQVGFSLSANGAPRYWVRHENKMVVDTSELGLVIYRLPALQLGFELEKVEYDSLDETWSLPWGERATARNFYKGQTIFLREKDPPNRELQLMFRAYDDGIAFRYHIPRQLNLTEFQLVDESTEFDIVDDPTCWWIPGDWDSYEHLFNTTKVSEIDALSKTMHPNLVCSTIPYNAVATPLTMRLPSGLHLSIHEAALVDYPEMTLMVDRQNPSFTTELVGRKDSLKANLKSPFSTPWRSIQIGRNAGDLLESALILNLNEPNRVGDVSWFKPTKYMGIWWEMHLGKASWDVASGKHGATTSNAKKYIDFASANGIPALLIEGWNTGWERWMGFPDREGIFDFVTPYPDYNLEEVVAYGRSKGVELIMHHETSAAPRTYEQQLDTAYALMKRLGIHAAKTGYVGPILPEGEHHGGQWMVRHYQKTVEAAAHYQIALDIHEPIKDTGLRRTWPNFVSREGLRGQEFNAWSSDGCNPPEHLTIVPFTCGLAGPLDYTPGIFNLSLKPYKPDNQVKTTLAHQLALYVVVYSPVQMAADLPEFYQNQPGFQFIREVGVNWNQTKVLEAEIGDHVAIAREERETGAWFLGAITDENARDIKVSLDFLRPEVRYQVTVYRDGEGADWKTNPTALKIDSFVLTAKDSLAVHLGQGGGVAASFFPIRK
jgi:hypothetical protein